MTGYERTLAAIKGKSYDRQPIYGWVAANLGAEIVVKWGSVEAFEDHYEFDMAHIFGGPYPIRRDVVARLKEENEELTPDLLEEADFLPEVQFFPNICTLF